MARECIFCGERIGAFSSEKLSCGGYLYTVCSDCFDKYKELDEIDLANKIISTGRSKHSDNLREYVNDRIKYKQAEMEAEQVKEEEFNARHPEKEKCPKCGGSMHQYGPIDIKLGEETFLFSDWNRLMSGSMSVLLVRCRDCGYTEFYTPNENELM